MQTLYSTAQIAAVVQQLGKQINQDYAAQHEPLLVLIILKGALIFGADLLRQLTIPCEVELIRASSYRQGTSPGELSVAWGGIALEDRDILIVEDIVDTGQTARALIDHLGTISRSVKFCTLLDKPMRRTIEVPLDYIGMTLTGDPFIVGYGLDHAERYRELPYIAVLD